MGKDGKRKHSRSRGEKKARREEKRAVKKQRGRVDFPAERDWHSVFWATANWRRAPTLAETVENQHQETIHGVEVTDFTLDVRDEPNNEITNKKKEVLRNVLQRLG